MLSSQSYAFAVNSVLAGVTAFFMFLFHFGLYCRPIPAEEADLETVPREIPNLSVNATGSNAQFNTDSRDGAGVEM